jgi:hypothetical protein
MASFKLAVSSLWLSFCFVIYQKSKRAIAIGNPTELMALRMSKSMILSFQNAESQLAVAARSRAFRALFVGWLSIVILTYHGKLVNQY